MSAVKIADRAAEDRSAAGRLARLAPQPNHVSAGIGDLLGEALLAAEVEAVERAGRVLGSVLIVLPGHPGEPLQGRLRLPRRSRDCSIVRVRVTGPSPRAHRSVTEDVFQKYFAARSSWPGRHEPTGAARSHEHSAERATPMAHLVIGLRRHYERTEGPRSGKT